MELASYSKKFIHYYSEEFPPIIGSIIKNNPHLKNFADLGCGDGSILYSLNKIGLLDSFSRIYAVDLSDDRIRKIKQINPRINCLICDVCDIRKIADGEIDIAVVNQVIEHVLDDELLVREIWRILNKGGVVYLSTVFKKSYAWYFFKNKDNKWVIDPTHEREYTQDGQLLDKLEKCGFLITKNTKSLHWFALTDFILKRVGFKQNIYEENAFWRALRKIKIPILGYYNWEILCNKRN